ncbi:MAG: hypothetical protein KDK70_16875, partial [Myxococcales bacterium]|nr:hypothetical protein [Myxococcales bacterium]
MDPSRGPSPYGSPWQRLLHRWLIQYNPLYLVSAALVLVGVVLLSRGLAGGGLAAQLGVTGIAELYAWALIGSAALLVRIRLRRPAVMLALLAAAYQCDLTLHTETSVHLGQAGMLGTALWLASFGGKLLALAWALQLRLSRSARVVAGLGAAVIALVPWALRVLEPRAASSLLAVSLFAVFAAGLWSSRRVESRVPLDDWGHTVARRSLRAVWLGWGGMVLVHASFWVSQHPSLDTTALLPTGVLLATRWMRRESSVWITVLATLGMAGAVHPALLSLLAAMAAGALLLRALRRPTVVAPAPAPAQLDDD